MLWFATLSAEVANVACPDAFKLLMPIGANPSLKVTVPVGTVVFPLGPVTVAVKVTDCPLVDGLSEEVSVVVEMMPAPTVAVPCM